MMSYMFGSGMAGMALFGWLWLVVWSVNSVLIMVLLWKLIEKYSKK